MLHGGVTPAAIGVGESEVWWAQVGRGDHDGGRGGDTPFRVSTPTLQLETCPTRETPIEESCA